jgi:hypothetical protein
MPFHGLPGLVEVPPDDPSERLGVEALAEARRVDDVHEEDRHRLPCGHGAESRKTLSG